MRPIDYFCNTYFFNTLFLDGVGTKKVCLRCSSCVCLTKIVL